MTRAAPAFTRGAIVCVTAALVLAKGAPGALAQDKVAAHYTIKMTGVTIGAADWRAAIGADSYAASASGSASGMLSVLVRGKGSATVQGAIKNGALSPATFASSFVEDKETDELRMTLEDGVVKDLVTTGDAPKGDRVPLTDEHRRGVLDPLTALMITPVANDEVLSPQTCNRSLPIFDGRRRYNLALSFKRTETVKADKGYAGPVLVCGVLVQPIAGHRPDSMVTKYVAGRRDIELWLAPIGAARVTAPYRLSIPTLVGTMDIRAVTFETSAATANKP